MTQRDGRLPPGIEEEEEEKTTVGNSPDPSAHSPSKVGPPNRATFAKNNTPTAFVPHPQSSSSPAVGSDRSPGAPAKSQAMPRPPPLALGAHPGDRGSSGPQPLTPRQSVAPLLGQHPHAVGQPGHLPGGMMFNPQSGPPSGALQRDSSFAGSAPSNTQLATTNSGMTASGQSLGFRADSIPREGRSSPFAVVRSRAYSFVLDARGQPIELGSGRFAKVFLGEERWLESKTDFRRAVVVKLLQKGVSEDDHMRFQMEMELLERVQGHPSIVELFASGEGEDQTFLPPILRDKCEAEFMVLEKLDMSLEERLKGSRNRDAKEDLLACDLRERLFRVLDYMIPVASAIEYAHLVRNICHRDIKPANVLVGLPDPNLRGSTLQVRLADFNVAKLSDEEVQFGMTQMKAAVPGTLFFQSPEQETNILELLVNVQQGVPEVEYFEDFYIQIAKNASVSLFNRNEQYPIRSADRARKRLVLGRPFRAPSETNVRARIQKSVGRPADIYSLGATFYYL
ncbi:MAG TPA: protein kinase, partial [Labilithrix sp.]|nr:protein kinase [Labilithrix sp.]